MDPTSTTSSFVELKCVKRGSRLRVCITSSGYINNANCQFPRGIRAEGRRYLVPSEDISLTSTRNSYFYRVKKNNIRILDDDVVEEQSDEFQEKVSFATVYGDQDNDCCVCLDMKVSVVFSPCGHYCCCEECSTQLISQQSTRRTCPLCRGPIDRYVTLENVVLI